jgi:RNA polymerase sigma factor (sigma-70 family)
MARATVILSTTTSSRGLAPHATCQPVRASRSRRAPTAPRADAPSVRTETPPSLEHRLVEALPTIERVVLALGRRYRMSPDERDEFLGLVRLRLVQDDYAVLRRFEGRSRLSTYLRTVIQRIFLDERVKAWGRWRPSAQAVRLGSDAVELERLLERQHLTIEQAIEARRAADPDVAEDVLRTLAHQLPRRAGRRFVDDSVLAQLAAPGPGPDVRAAQVSGGRLRRQVSAALRGVAADLPARTRLLLRLRFVHDTSVADVSRTLGCDQKPLYRELDRALAQLRRGIEARGISAAQVRAVIAAGWAPAEAS